MTIKSVPNLLTLSRIGLSVLVFLALGVDALAGHVETGQPRPLLLVALLAFILCALTDFFDGWLARRLGAQSAWGAILDPIADKIAVLAAVLGLILLYPRVGIAGPGFLILFREVFVSGLREAGSARGLSFPVTYLAKWKTTVQLVALSLELIAACWQLALIADIADGLLWIAAILTVWTGAQYTLTAARQLGDA